MMPYEEFQSLRRSENHPSEAFLEYYDSVLAELSNYIDAPLEIIRENVSGQGISKRFRTNPFDRLPLNLGIIGTSSISLAYDRPPVVSATTIIAIDGVRLFHPNADNGILNLQYHVSQGWDVLKWFITDFYEFHPENWNWRPLPNKPKPEFSLKKLADQLGFNPLEIEENPHRFPIWGRSGFALELEIKEETGGSVLCCKVLHDGVALVSKDREFVKKIRVENLDANDQ